jgi:WD40 repeat protein/cytoskeletal protein RodZ
MSPTPKQESKKFLGHLKSAKLMDRISSFLFGDDIFISYSHRDALNYSPALAMLLAEQKFVCYLDQYGTDADNLLPPSLLRRLRRSTVFILVGTEGAAMSKAVKEEVETFKKTGRPIIPIDVDGSLERAEWVEIVKGIPVSEDRTATKATRPQAMEGAAAATFLSLDSEQLIRETEENRKAAQPSPLVVSRVSNSFEYTKRNQRQRRMFLAALILLVSSFGIAAWSIEASVKARHEADNANKEANRAQQSAVAAQRAEDQANSLAKEARRQQTQAETERDKAQTEAQIAASAKERADEQAAKAEDRERTAKEKEAQATKEAGRQRLIASVIDQISNANRLAEEQPDAALALNVAAYQTASKSGLEIPQAQFSLFTNLQHYDHLMAIKRVLDGRVSEVAACHNGKVLLAAEDGPKVIFWDLAHNRPIEEPRDDRGKTPTLARVACVSGGAICATWDYDNKTIIIWDIIDGGEDFKVNFYRRLLPESVHTTAPFVFIDKDHLATWGDNGGVIIWDLRKQKPEPEHHNFLKAAGIASSLAVTADGKTMAAGFNGNIILWQVGERDELADSLHYHERPASSIDSYVNSLAFSPDGRYLAATGASGNVALWYLSGWKEKKKLKQPDDTQNKAAGVDANREPSADGLPKELLMDAGSQVVFLGRRDSSQLMFTIKNENEIYLWSIGDPPEGKTSLTWEKPVPFPSGIHSIIPLADGSATLATGSGDGAVAIWDMSDALRLRNKLNYWSDLDDNVKYISYDERNELLLAGWNQRLNKLRFFLYTESSCDAGHTLDRERIEEAKSGTFGFMVEPGGTDLNSMSSVNVVDAYSRQTVKQISNIQNIKREEHYKLALSPNKNRLAVKQDNAVIVLDVTDGKNPKPLPRPLSLDKHKTPSSLIFSADSSMVFVGYSDGEVILWDVERSEPLKRFISAYIIEPSWHTRAGVNVMAVSNDNRMLATSNGYNSISLWDTRTGQLLAHLMGGQFATINFMAFSRDRHKLAAVGFEVTVWDIDPEDWIKEALPIAESK